MVGGLLIAAERAAEAIVASVHRSMNFPGVRTFTCGEGSDAASVAGLAGGKGLGMQQGVETVESGLAELGETLSAIALKPYDPPVEPRALLRLLLVLRTLDEPDELAGTA